MAENIAVVEWEDTTPRDVVYNGTDSHQWVLTAHVTKVSGKLALSTDLEDDPKTWNTYEQVRVGTDYAAYGMDEPILALECELEITDGYRPTGNERIGWSVKADTTGMKCTRSDDPEWKNARISGNYIMSLGGLWIGYGNGYDSSGRDLAMRIYENGEPVYDGDVQYHDYPIIDGEKRKVWGVAGYAFEWLEPATGLRVNFAVTDDSGTPLISPWKENTPYRFEWYCPAGKMKNGTWYLPVHGVGGEIKRFEPVGGGLAVATYSDGSMGEYVRGGGMYYPLDGRGGGVVRVDTHPMAVNNGNAGLWNGEWYEF